MNHQKMAIVAGEPGIPGSRRGVLIRGELLYTGILVQYRKMFLNSIIIHVRLHIELQQNFTKSHPELTMSRQILTETLNHSAMCFC